MPSANPLVDEGAVPGRPDMAYRWAHDETSVTFSALVDGEWRPLTRGALDGDAYLDDHGEPVAVAVRGPDNRSTLVASVDVLDRALADLKSGTGQPDAARSGDDDGPKLCRRVRCGSARPRESDIDIVNLSPVDPFAACRLRRKAWDDADAADERHGPYCIWSFNNDRRHRSGNRPSHA